MLYRKIAVPSLNTLLGVVSEKVIQSTDPSIRSSMVWWLDKLLPALENNAKSTPALLKDLQNPSRYFATIQGLKQQILSDFNDRHPVMLADELLNKIESEFQSRGEDPTSICADVSVLRSNLNQDFFLKKNEDELVSYIAGILKARKQQAVSNFQDSVSSQLSRRKKYSPTAHGEEAKIDSNEFQALKRLGFEKQVLSQLIKHAKQKNDIKSAGPSKNTAMDQAKIDGFNRASLVQLIHHQSEKTEMILQCNGDRTASIETQHSNKGRFESALRAAKTSHDTAVQTKTCNIAKEKQIKRTKQHNEDLARLANELAKLSLEKKNLTNKDYEDDYKKLRQSIDGLESELEETHRQLFKNEQILIQTYDRFFEKKEGLRKEIRKTQNAIKTDIETKKKTLETEINNAKAESEKKIGAYEASISPVIDAVTLKNTQLNDNWNPLIEEIDEFNTQKDVEFDSIVAASTTIFKNQRNRLETIRNQEKKDAIAIFNNTCHAPLAENKKERSDNLQRLSEKFSESTNQLHSNLTRFKACLDAKTRELDRLDKDTVSLVTTIESAINQLE